MKALHETEAVIHPCESWEKLKERFAGDSLFVDGVIKYLGDKNVIGRFSMHLLNSEIAPGTCKSYLSSLKMGIKQEFGYYSRKLSDDLDTLFDSKILNISRQYARMCKADGRAEAGIAEQPFVSLEDLTKLTKHFVSRIALNAAENESNRAFCLLQWSLVGRVYEIFTILNSQCKWYSTSKCSGRMKVSI